MRPVRSLLHFLVVPPHVLVLVLLGRRLLVQDFGLRPFLARLAARATRLRLQLRL